MRSAILALLLTAGFARTAEAGWGLRNSFGMGVWLVEPQLTPHLVIGTNPDGSPQVSPDKLVSGCNNMLCYDGNRRQPINFEVMPYYSFGIISIDLGVVFNMESRTDLGFDFRLRPGLRVFPFMGLFARAFLDMNIAQIQTAFQPTSGTLAASFEGSLGIAVGYQLKLGPWGIFGEVGMAPRLWGRGIFNMPFEVRIGILLEPS